jgi:pimeloyl-ACP methyl ester carboxylesterase
MVTSEHTQAALGILPGPVMCATGLGPIEYAEEGEGDAVLCLHGAMGGYEQGVLLDRVLGEPGHRCLAPSRPGYLRTPLSSGRSPEAQADLFAAMLDVLGVERVAVMAVSGGGPSAIHFALRHAGRCRGLVLVSTVATTVANRLPLSFALTGLLARLPWVAASIERKAMQDPEQSARRSFTNPIYFDRVRGHPEAWAQFQALQASTVHRMAARMAGTRNDVRVTQTRTYPLEAINVPTLIVHGTCDPLVPFAEHGQAAARRIPGAELVVLDGGEHAAIFSHRDEARSRVTAFLRRCQAEDPAPSGPERHA